MAMEKLRYIRRSVFTISDYYARDKTLQLLKNNLQPLHLIAKGLLFISPGYLSVDF